MQIFAWTFLIWELGEVVLYENLGVEFIDAIWFSFKGEKREQSAGQFACLKRDTNEMFQGYVLSFAECFASKYKVARD